MFSLLDYKGSFSHVNIFQATRSLGYAGGITGCNIPKYSNVYSWCLFKPKVNTFPYHMEDQIPSPGYPFNPIGGDHHMELVHNTNKTHYDSVIAIKT